MNIKYKYFSHFFIICQTKMLVMLGCQEPKLLVEKKISIGKKWVLNHVGLQYVLHLGNGLLIICLLFSPGLIQSQYTGALWRRGICVQWSVWVLLLYFGMIYSALSPWPQFAGAKETWGFRWPVRVLPTNSESETHSILSLDNEGLDAWELSMVLSVVMENKSSPQSKKQT